MESSLYLRNQLLRDADWASMAHSLELRVPLVDARLRHRMAAIDFEPARSRGKAALVRRVAPELPAALFRRPKSGFRVPLPATVAPSGPSLGAGSRAMALHVLESFGVPIQSPC
jgi:asparagine synthase (glutamine-hydrolysing)